jgi:phosphatidylglycerol---prolipoprotein diacylglyceryl transferase
VSAATIIINVDPTIDIGPISLPWHGLTTALGIVIAAFLAYHVAGERGLRRERILDLAGIIVLSGFVGAKILYLIEQGALLQPDEWFDSQGYSFYGALVLGPLAGGVYLRRSGSGLGYLDALAAGFPLGMALGRVGDILIGEHHGPPSTLPWAISYSNPEADVPNPDVAYHPGALYESLVSLLIFAIVWPLRGRFRRPGLLFATVVGLYSVGRFAIFFVRSDSDELALGLSNSQWISLALVFAATALGYWAWRRQPHPETA